MLRSSEYGSLRKVKAKLEVEGVRIALGTLDLIAKEQGLRSVHPQPKPALTEEQKLYRKKWCARHLNDTKEEVRAVVYSDESTFILNPNTRTVWIGKDEPIPKARTSKYHSAACKQATRCAQHLMSWLL
jgi:hypothetical protein